MTFAITLMTTDIVVKTVAVAIVVIFTWITRRSASFVQRAPLKRTYGYINAIAEQNFMHAAIAYRRDNM